MSRSNFAWLVLVAAVALLFFLKRTSWAQAGDVETALRANALVIDVRTPGEFAGGSIPGVTNVPLDQLEKEIAALAPDREKPILLHCLSGGRSASACAMLKRMGYARVFNLGSYARAEKLIQSTRKN